MPVTLNPARANASAFRPYPEPGTRTLHTPPFLKSPIASSAVRLGESPHILPSLRKRSSQNVFIRNAPVLLRISCQDKDTIP